MKNNFLRIVMGAGAMFICAMACSKDNVQTLTGGQIIPTVCDTVNMKYAADIVPILQQYCYTCHGNGSTGGSGGINLDGYANLKAWVDNGFLVGNVSHAPGFIGMPYGQPKLDTCTINKIISWVTNGAQNN
jgi:hypothetical protein